MSKIPLARVLNVIGADLPFLPAAPPEWLQRAVLNKFPRALVYRFGLVPTGLAETLSGMTDEQALLLGVEPSQIYQYAYEDLAPGCSVLYFAVDPDVKLDLEAIHAAVTEMLKEWGKEFPDELNDVFEYVHLQKTRADNG
jgi:hypothetical protein